MFVRPTGRVRSRGEKGMPERERLIPPDEVRPQFCGSFGLLDDSEQYQILGDRLPRRPRSYTLPRWHSGARGDSAPHLGPRSTDPSTRKVRARGLEPRIYSDSGSGFIEPDQRQGEQQLAGINSETLAAETPGPVRSQRLRRAPSRGTPWWNSVTGRAGLQYCSANRSSSSDSARMSESFERCSMTLPPTLAHSFIRGYLGTAPITPALRQDASWRDEPV